MSQSLKQERNLSLILTNKNENLQGEFVDLCPIDFIKLAEPLSFAKTGRKSIPYYDRLQPFFF